MLPTHWVLAFALVAPAAPEPQDAELETIEAAPAPGDDQAARNEIEAGLASFVRGRFQTARAAFERAVAAAPTSAAAHFYYGYAIYKVAEPKRPFHPEKRDAADHFATAFELDPSFRPVWAR